MTSVTLDKPVAREHSRATGACVRVPGDWRVVVENPPTREGAA